MPKQSSRMRAVDIAARMLDNRPYGMTPAEFLYKNDVSNKSLTVDKLEERKDISVSTLYQLCKAQGYQIIVYNPNPPKGMQSSYTVGERKATICAREHREKVFLRKDPYTGKLYATVRKYKRKKKPLRRIEHDGENS